MTWGELKKLLEKEHEVQDSDKIACINVLEGDTVTLVTRTRSKDYFDQFEIEVG